MREFGTSDHAPVVATFALMNLRLRLIVAFFLLSVVPLAAVTLYTYTSNAKACGRRRATKRSCSRAN